MYGQHFPLEAVSVEGIRGLAELDMAYARELGYCIRLLAVIEDAGSEVEVRVHPTLVPSSHILASVKGVFNALLIESDGAGELLLYGRGAGREPTASAVITWRMPQWLWHPSSSVVLSLVRRLPSAVCAISIKQKSVISVFESV